VLCGKTLVILTIYSDFTIGQVRELVELLKTKYVHIEKKLTKQKQMH